MQKQTSLYIPKPCHEDWNKMTPIQQGKFCASCNKQVVDFSLMSDNQILNFLSNQSEKLCGRFDAEQLQRPLVETKIKKKKSWWLALTMPLLFLFDRSNAQKNIPEQIDTAISPTVKRQPEIMGKLVYHPLKQITVSGKVVDENNEPLAYVSVIQKGFVEGTTTDSLGNFSINISSYEDSITLAASYIGYETIERTIQSSEKNINITMKLQPAALGEIVVVGYTVRYESVKPIDTVKTAIKKILSIPAFKVYPNPAIRGSTIHLEIKQAGEYQLYLLDDQSRLIKAEEINIDSEKSSTSITIPSNIAAGIYYVRLIDEQKKKSYTEKIIIQ